MFADDWELGTNPTLYRTIFNFGLPYPDSSGLTSSFASADDRYEKQRENYDIWVQQAGKFYYIRTQDSKTNLNKKSILI